MVMKERTPFSKIRPGSPHKSRQKSTGFPAQKSTLVKDFVSAEAFGFRRISLMLRKDYRRVRKDLRRARSVCGPRITSRQDPQDRKRLVGNSICRASYNKEV